MASDKVDKNLESVHTEAEAVNYLKDMIKHLQEENSLLQQELLKTKHAQTNKIGFAFLMIGVSAFAASILSNNTAIAFIGLGMTFWGALFMFVRPVRFVRGALLDWTVASSYATIDRILEDLNYKGQGIYVPPFPKEVYLPEHLKNLKEIIVYITATNIMWTARAEDKFPMPTLDEIAQARFMLKNPRGITIIPPGNGLLDIYEKELKIDFSKANLDYIQRSLPRLISDLRLAASVEIRKSHWTIDVTIKNSIYEDLYSPKRGLKSVHIAGCPLASSLACVLTKTTGKLVTIVKDQASPESNEVKVWYRMLES